MNSALNYTIAIIFSFSVYAQQDKDTKKQINISPFGTKPIQLGIGKHGIERKEGGYICELDAMNGHYSEWGETEKDARTLVVKACSRKSGLFLCKEDKVKCKEDKP